MRKVARKQVLLQGNEACVEGALMAGCRFYAGYPITPATEIMELMAQKLPALKPAEMIKALEKAGFQIVRQTGSHVIMWKEDLPRPIPIPRHARELKRNLQNRLIKQAGFTPEEFRNLL